MTNDAPALPAGQTPHLPTGNFLPRISDYSDKPVRMIFLFGL
jgi:hypothetical protein